MISAIDRQFYKLLPSHKSHYLRELVAAGVGVDVVAGVAVVVS